MIPVDSNEFNTKLAKLMQGLKKEGLALKVQQGYKGTGSKSAHRQIWVNFTDKIKPLDGAPAHDFRGTTDVWLESAHVRIGGVVPFTAIKGEVLSRNPAMSYKDQTPETVYAWIVEQFKSRA